MSPVFGHGHLRLYLLKLLGESPRHGYELIQELSERFGGTYSPSAGTIYPRLAKLEEEGLVTKESEGRKTVYRITDAGRAELAARADELQGIEDGLDSSIRVLADDVRTDVDRAMRSLRAELASAARTARHENRAAGEGAKTRTTSDFPSDAQGASRRALRDAEVALVEFRTRVRTALRKRAAQGTLEEQAVQDFRQELSALGERFLSRLDH